MQFCDATCWWCTRRFFDFFRDRMRSQERERTPGDGAFGPAAATSCVDVVGERVEVSTAPRQSPVRRYLPPGVYVRYSRRFRWTRDDPPA